MESKAVFSVFRFMAEALAIGMGVIVFLVVGLLFQRERAKEVIAQVRRAVERNPSQPGLSASLSKGDRSPSVNPIK
jgi:hypothetical protein